MLDVVIRPEQPALLGGEHDKEDGAFGALGILRKCLSELNDTDGAGPIIVGAVPDLRVVRTVQVGSAVVVVVRADDDGLGAQRGITSFKQAGDVIAETTVPGRVLQMDGD